MPTTDERTIFGLASASFVERARKVGPEQWSGATPCTDWDVRLLVNHVAGEYLWVPEILAGKTIADVGDRLDGDVLGEDPLQSLVNARNAALNAVNSPGALETTAHLSFGDVPAGEYVKQMTIDSVIHSWDLAHAIGTDESLDPELVDFAYADLQGSAEEWRAGGAFGPEQAPSGQSTQAKLLALTGR
jgi:uncharacterized protein (TIGR03086 family)